MALNLDSVGKKIGPFTRDYEWKDAVLYALGVGAGFSDLSYCYEKDLKVIPSFSIASILDINLLMEMGKVTNINLAGILHGEQELIFHNPIPTSGTLTTEGEVTNVYDKGEGVGALAVAKFTTKHSNGKKLFTSIITVFARLDGGFGGVDAPKVEFAYPDRAPDFTVKASPSVDQPLLYRLSGDTFQLHVDPEFAKLSGFEKPIMHGLCSHGFACRALIESLIPGMPEQVRTFNCRFSKTLYPGVPVETLIWKTADGKAVWKTVNSETGEDVMTNGVFEYGDLNEETIRFDERVAIVTGAGAGLGRVYALELARRGAKVVVNDLGGARDGSGAGSSSPAEVVAQEIKDAGGSAVANFDNVATVEGGENIVKAAIDAFGTVDIVINNAGILRDKSFLKMEPENWHAVLDVHLTGAFNVTKPAFAVMKEKGYGRIVMTTSAAGLYGNFGQTNYSAAKMALVGFMNTLKLEGRKNNVLVNTVAPLAASRLTEDVLPPDLFAKMKPEYVSPLTLFLSSDACNDTGGIYNVGMGFVSRAAIATGPGMVIGKEGEIPSPEDIMQNMDGLSSMKDPKIYGELNDQIGDLMAAFTKKKDTVGSAKGMSSVPEVFEAMAKSFVSDAAKGLDVVFQYQIVGDGGGDWFCAVNDGSLNIEKGTHEKPVCTMKMDSGPFVSMMNGDMAPMQAFTSGKLQISGDVMKSQLIEKIFKLA